MPIIVTVADFPFGKSVSFLVFVAESSGVLTYKAPFKKPLGEERSRRELMMPSAGMVPTREKNLSLKSSFHICIVPSHELK